MWAPSCYLLDAVNGTFGVLRFFRLDEFGHRVICEELHLSLEQRQPPGFGE
jgi:hypothetical protein